MDVCKFQTPTSHLFFKLIGILPHPSQFLPILPIFIAENVFTKIRVGSIGNGAQSQPPMSVI